MPFHKQSLGKEQEAFRFDFILEPEPDLTKFENFLALPKELRGEIYAIIFKQPENATSRLTVRDQNRPFESAICRISKQIRDEALPLFYRLYELKIDVLTVVPKRKKPRLTFGSEHWRSISSQKFRWLRHVRVSFFDTALYFGRRLFVELSIRFFTSNGRYQYSLDVVTDISTWRVGYQWLPQPYFAFKLVEHREKVEAAVRAQSQLLLDWLISNEKFGKWTPADFKRLVEWDEDLLHWS